MQRKFPTIILEGPDGAGKSTLLTTLAKVLGMGAHHTGAARHTLEDLEEALKFVEDRPGQLFDRCSHISNGVYARVQGRPDLIPEHEMTRRLRDDVSPIIVFCRFRGEGSEAAMLENMVKSPKPHKSEEDTQAVVDVYLLIVAEYDRVMQNLEGVVPIVAHDFRVDSLEDLVSTLIEFSDPL